MGLNFIITVFVIFMLFLIVCNTKLTYSNRKKDKIIKKQVSIISEKDLLIEKLQKTNDFSAGLLHRNRKVIPSIETAVINFFEGIDQNNFNEKIRSEYLDLIEELKQMRLEYSSTIESFKKVNKILPLTKITFVDGMFDFMHKKAASIGIDFDLIVAPHVPTMVKTVISEEDLKTLIGELIENSIIAFDLNKSDSKKILVYIGTSINCYELSVSDNGVPFEIDTLLSLGIEKTSTHFDSGGSGIGYMTIFSTLKKYNASLIVNEYHPDSINYLKKVSVKFDGKGQYLVCSYRSLEITKLSNRKDLILEIQ